MSLSVMHERWKRILSSNDTSINTVVACGDHDVAGFCAFAFANPGESWSEHVGDPMANAFTGEILALYVSPARWRLGIGRSLVDQVLRQLANHGCRTVGLWVLTKNLPAIGFYTSLNFNLIDSHAFHWPTQQTAIRMQKGLGYQERRAEASTARGMARR
jgi:ribosomal protein S18 acetylase RimI-like enzyme